MDRPSDYKNDPDRDENLKVNSNEPFNAEPFPRILVDKYTTPVNQFYVRNHAPVPDVDPDEFRLVVDGIVKQRLEFTLNRLKANYTEHDVYAALLCAGNRRRELDNVKKVNGLLWDQAAISNGKWSGILLHDVLKDAGAALDNVTLHVEFYGYDKGKDPDQYYGSSVPMSRAGNPEYDVLLAYKLNDEILSRDHGFPLRVVIPGIIGARSVKWLHHISVTQRESQNHYMQEDYKILPQHVTWDSVTDWWHRVPPVMDVNLQSAICDPAEGSAIDPHVPYTVKGYAVSNGHRVVRVEVSCDEGNTWKEAALTDRPPPASAKETRTELDGHFWAWTVWQITMNVPAPCQLVCRAFDSVNNSQPSDLKAVWNIRGVMNNAWHRVNVKPIGILLES